MKSLTRIGVLVTATLGLLVGHIQAQSISLSTASVSMPFATTDFNSSTGAAQITKSSAHSFTVTAKNNVSWTVSVKTQTSTFSFLASSGDSNPNKPASDLALREPFLSLTWIPLTATNQVLTRGSGSSGALPMDYRLNANLANDPPGTYSIAVVYTVTSP